MWTEQIIVLRLYNEHMCADVHHILHPEWSMWAKHLAYLEAVFPISENVSDTDNVLLYATCVKGQI